VETTPTLTPEDNPRLLPSIGEAAFRQCCRLVQIGPDMLQVTPSDAHLTRRIS
jgi:hypothetical protein